MILHWTLDSWNAQNERLVSISNARLQKMLIRQVLFENESGIAISSKQISNPCNI